MRWRRVQPHVLAADDLGEQVVVRVVVQRRHLQAVERRDERGYKLAVPGAAPEERQVLQRLHPLLASAYEWGSAE